MKLGVSNRVKDITKAFSSFKKTFILKVAWQRRSSLNHFASTYDELLDTKLSRCCSIVIR